MKKATPETLSVWRPMSLNQFIYGVPHYPEHVDESYWERDAERMAAAGFNTVRMGEFAWHIWEPKQGHFHFELFDKAIDGLAQYGISTILCTPTATPPRWLTTAHPEVLRVDEHGRQASHGSRQHGDTTSAVLRDFSRQITTAMTTHYANNKHVIGWQTDNEFNTTAPTSFSESCAEEFRQWCRIKYQIIEALNAAWGGDFWATHYDNFEQIVLPLYKAPGYVSPGHQQDYHRFLADATAAFQHDQIEIIRETNPNWFVFHNLGHLDDIDFRGQFGQDLDFIGFDMYPMLNDEMRRHGGHAYGQALHLDICRAYSGNFMVPEQASGFGSQPGFSTMTPEPGEMRRMALSSVSRGADSLLFFRWRPAHFGAEIYWMGLLDHDDQARRRYQEAVQFGQDIAAIEHDLLGTYVRMDVGIAGADFDNQEAYKTYPMGLPSPLEDSILLHKALYQRGIAAGFIHPEDDLSRLRVLYIPHWLMWDDAWTERVQAFVEGGGTLIVSAMSATRTRDNHIHRELAPANGLSALLGIKVEEFGRVAASNADGLFEPCTPKVGLGPAVVARTPASSTQRQYGIRYGSDTFRAQHLYEKLQLNDDVESLASWSSRFLEGNSAVTRRKVGKGQAIYVATYLSDELVQKLVGYVILEAGVSSLLGAHPSTVEVTERVSDEGYRLLFIINTDYQPAEVSLLENGVDLLTGQLFSEHVTLAGYGVVILKMQGY